jgi:hypothetical protein
VLFPEDEGEVEALEADLGAGRSSDAIARCELLANRQLARVAEQAGLGQSAAAAAGLLGVGGERWLAFRQLVRRARDGGPVDHRDALEAFGLVIEIRLRHDRAQG